VSVLEQLHDLERQVVARLRELEPLVREYEQLRAAAERLGISYQPRVDTGDGDGPRPSRRPRARAAPPRPNAKANASAPVAADRGERATKSANTGRAARRAARRRPAAAPGQRQQQMLALVVEQPGITVADVAQRLGIDATGLYRVMHQLAETGQVRKDGRQLYPGNQTRPQTTGNDSVAPRGSKTRTDAQVTAEPAKSR
jgi:transposase-like protein